MASKCLQIGGPSNGHFFKNISYCNEVVVFRNGILVGGVNSFLLSMKANLES
jgi:hypothetical protein